MKSTTAHAHDDKILDCPFCGNHMSYDDIELVTGSSKTVFGGSSIDLVLTCHGKDGEDSCGATMVQTVVDEMLDPIGAIGSNLDTFSARDIIESIGLLVRKWNQRRAGETP